MSNVLRSVMVLATALLLARQTHAQGVMTQAQSGTADAGIASKPIADVAVHDTVNGQPAVLTNPGQNAILKAGAGFQSGMINLTPSTGQVSTTKAVPAGVYPVTYILCDINDSSNCASQTDTVNVITSTIVPASYTVTAVAGVATTVIKNIAANDMVNGAQAILGNLANGSNATVAEDNVPTPWPAGIVLTPSTGTVKTNAAQPAGVYALTYTLCDRNGPPANCNSSGTLTITITSDITTGPIAGSAVVGTSGTPIGNVTIPDLVNGAAVTLGAGGNATVTQGPGWPPGLTLDPTTGAIDSDPTVPVGTYPLQFTLCDTSTPANCPAPLTATVAITPAYAEVQATVQQMGDVEFDFGRDGAPCPLCNYGDGTDRANWTDRFGHLWIAHLDTSTGLFTPLAQDELADTSAYFWETYKNGPEWAFSSPQGPGSNPVSQLVYSRYQPGQQPQPQPTQGYSGAAIATQTGFNADGSANWKASFFPGALVAGSVHSDLPEASQCNTDPEPLAIWHAFGSPLKLYIEPVSTAPGTVPTPLPFPPGVVSNAIGERFVPCTHQLLYQATAPYGASGTAIQQVFWYDIDTGVTEQLTTDPTSKSSGFMFQAPDFDDKYIFFTVTSHLTIDVYEQSGTNADGSPAFTLVNTIYSPDPDETYINSPEPFINCTPVCTTYVFLTLSNGDTQKGVAGPNGLAVAALSPQTPLFNILVRANDPATRQRLDPEYFITPQGPYLYYNRIVPFQRGVSEYKNTGEWFIDMQLGAPSGSCVGSSAEDGLVSGC